MAVSKQVQVKCQHGGISKGKCISCGKEMDIWCNHYKGVDKANYCRISSCQEKVLKRV